MERGFSYQNATKTKFHNRLGPEHLDQLVRLRLNASKADSFPFNLAYKHWIEAKHRHNVVSKPCEKIDIEDSDTDSSGDSGGGMTFSEHFL